MKTMSASEVSRNFASVLDKVSQGETVVVTRAGKRLATLGPAPAGNGAALADFLASRAGTLDDNYAKDIDETRALLTEDDPWAE